VSDSVSSVEKQGEAKGGTLKRSAIGMPIFYFGMPNSDKLEEIEPDSDKWHKFWEWDSTSDAKRNGSSERTGQAPFLGSATVYNRAEFDGLPASKFLKQIKGKAIQKGARHPVADQVAAASGAVIHHGGNRAFYSTGTDSVTVPEFKDFHTSEGYYSTLFHELTHWTGGPKRLHRTFGATFGDEVYAFEELVAELGASFVASALGIAGQIDPNNVAYIQNWIKKLQNDPKVLMKASALAMQAFDYLKVPHFAADVEPVADGPSAEAGHALANRARLFQLYRGRG
jgi:antirestriction protein ArdC